MPYIKKEKRPPLKDSIENIIHHLQHLDDDDKEGTVNYTISRIVAGGMKPKTGWRYTWLSRAHEAFVAAGDEFKRRMLDPYEDQAIAKNGDIPEYENPF